MKRCKLPSQRVNTHQTQTTEWRGATNCRLAVAVNRYALKWKPPESPGDLAVQGRPPRQTFKTHCCFTHVWKCNGWVGGGTCQKVKFNKMQGNTGKEKQLKREKKKRMKLYSYSSQTLIIWQILFWMMAIFWERERGLQAGRESEEGFMYLIIRWS